MSSAQDRTVVGALLLAESAWLFAVFSLFGLGLGLGGSPLAWLSGLFILVASFFATRGLQYVVMPAILANVSAMVAGIVVLYLTLGFQISSGVHNGHGHRFRRGLHPFFHHGIHCRLDLFHG